MSNGREEEKTQAMRNLGERRMFVGAQWGIADFSSGTEECFKEKIALMNLGLINHAFGSETEVCEVMRTKKKRQTLVGDPRRATTNIA